MTFFMCDLVKLLIISLLVVFALLYQTSLPCRMRQSIIIQLNATSNNKTYPNGFSHKLFDYMSFYLRKKPYPGISIYIDYTVTRMKLKPRHDVAPVLPDFIPVFNDVSFNYTIEIPQCMSTLSNETSLILIINSAPKNLNRRNSIRETWLQHIKMLNSLKGGPKSIKIVGVAFFVGISSEKMNEEIRKESDMFKDILQVDLLDNYYDLSVKVTSLLSWIVHRCEMVDFVLKVDDDVYVNVRNLETFIRQADESSIYGTEADGAVQDIGKWKVWPHVYPWKSYPKYFQGPAVLLPGKAVKSLLAAAQTIPYYPFDDVYLTGFCAEKAAVSRITCDSFLDRLTQKAPGACFSFLTIAWMTWKTEQMRTSHLSVDKVYSNQTRCFLTKTKRFVNLDEKIKFDMELL